MQQTVRTMLISGALTLGAALALPGTVPALSSASAAAMQQTAPFVYTLGAQGLGYYAAPAQQPVAVARASASRPRFREHGSGRSVRLAKPWLNQFN